MHNYCTIISKDSLYRGLLLYYSLKKHDPLFRIFMIFMTDDIRRLVEKMGLKGITPISISEIEENDKELKEARKTRDDKEYAWTIKSPAMLHIFSNYPDADHIVYIDADIEFYSSPEPLFQELSKYSILLTRERFYIQDNQEWYKRYGRFNGGCMGYMKNENTLEALRWLRQRCISWCYNRVEEGLYGDQIFIDEMYESFKDVGVSNNLGINATAWYTHACVMERSNGLILINGEPLIFYHYSGLIYYNEDEVDLCVYINLPDSLIKLIYEPYLKRIKGVSKFVSQYEDNFKEKVLLKNESGYYKNYYKMYKEISIGKHNHNFCTIVGKEYIIKALALYNSLMLHSKDFNLFICYMDDMTKTVLEAMNLERATLIPLQRIENSSLLAVKGRRSKSEYCWTLKSFLMLYLFENYQELHSLVYLDADLFFFANTEPIFEELNNTSILIVEQKDCKTADNTFGIYQAGFIGVVSDDNAIGCLKWWRDKCLEWCSSEQGHSDKWGDQKYLDRWPELFEGVRVTENWGIDAAIWNTFRNYSVKDNEILISGHSLIAYHFCCFEIFNEEDYNLWMWPNWILDEKIIRAIYLPYIKSLRKAMEKIREAGFNIVELWENSSGKNSAVNYYRYVHEE